MAWLSKRLIVNSYLLCTTGTRSFSASSRHAAPGKVGFIGLGNMGGHMARNLIKKGYPVVVYDVDKESVTQLKKDGADIADTPAEVAGQVKQVVTMLPSSPHVLEVYTGKNGILNTVQSGTLCLDSSTIDPAVSKDMEIAANEKGATYMDAPVSGGVVAARDALLTFMLGGPDNRVPEAKELLDNMGKNVVHCGPVGTGQTAKICNNMILGVTMIGVSESMNLAIQLGLDPKMLTKILNMSSGRCWVSEVYNPCPGVIEGIPSSNNYQGGFGTALMAKDLGLAQNAATANRVPTPMGSLAHQLYRLLSNTEYATKDFGSVFKFLQEQEEKKEK